MSRTHSSPTLALVWRRVDFRETSRIVTLVTRELGKITALAKGAHRPGSPFLGVLDFLNLIEVSLSQRRPGLRLMSRPRLVQERRSLRHPHRFLAGSYLAELCDRGFLEERSDPQLFDLLQGGLTLLEKCPETALARVLIGLELRLLDQLGALPLLDRCNQCDAPLRRAWRPAAGSGLYCSRHAPLGGRVVGGAVLDFLRRLEAAPGRDWPHLDLPQPPAALEDLMAGWLAAATDRGSRLRRLALSGGPGRLRIRVGREQGQG